MVENRIKGGSAVILVGAVLAVVGTLMSWITANIGFASLSRSGLSYTDDAKVVLVLALLVGVAAVGPLTGWTMPTFIRPWISIVLGLACVGLCIYDATVIQGRINTLSADDSATASIGPGLYLTIAGAGLIILGAVALQLIEVRRSKPQTSSAVV
jgi:ABC-type Fe3+-siderophore transport system permease subunit